MTDQDGSCINKMSKILLFSKIVLVKSLFLQIFYKKILRDFRIIVYSCPQMSKLS